MVVLSAFRIFRHKIEFVPFVQKYQKIHPFGGPFSIGGPGLRRALSAGGGNIRPAGHIRPAKAPISALKKHI